MDQRPAYVPAIPHLTKGRIVEHYVLSNGRFDQRPVKGNRQLSRVFFWQLAFSVQLDHILLPRLEPKRGALNDSIVNIVLV